MKEWKVGYSFGGGYIAYDWFLASTKAKAKRDFRNENPDADVESVEERVDFNRLFEEAEQAIVDAVSKSKHLQVDDTRGNGADWFMIPVWYVRITACKPECEIVREFTFTRRCYESEAEMVERFHQELGEFVGQNWKRIDR